MKRLLRFLELCLDASCSACMGAETRLKEFAAKGEDASPPLERFTLTVSKKPGTDGKVHEYHLAVLDWETNDDNSRSERSGCRNSTKRIC